MKPETFTEVERMVGFLMAYSSVYTLLGRAREIICEGVPGVNPYFALNAVFETLEMRYRAGERTRELYDAMMKVR
jgi:hypothetical protein